MANWLVPPLLVPCACTTGRRSEATLLTTVATCAWVTFSARPTLTTFPPRKSMPRLNPQKMIARIPGMITARDPAKNQLRFLTMSKRPLGGCAANSSWISV